MPKAQGVKSLRRDAVYKKIYRDEGYHPSWMIRLKVSQQGTFEPCLNFKVSLSYLI